MVYFARFRVQDNLTDSGVRYNNGTSYVKGMLDESRNNIDANDLGQGACY